MGLLDMKNGISINIILSASSVFVSGGISESRTAALVGLDV